MKTPGKPGPAPTLPQLWLRLPGRERVAAGYLAYLRRPFVRLGLRILLLVGLVVQAAFVALLCYYVDLTLDLMELWAMLARKHLEITL